MANNTLSSNDEFFFAATVTPHRRYMFIEDLDECFSILWNTSGVCKYVINEQENKLEKNEVLFLTEINQVSIESFEKINVIQFNRPFYCVNDNDSDIGCSGVLFFAAEHLPKIKLNNQTINQFTVLWQMIGMELDENDNQLQHEMLKLLLKRYLIMSLRIYQNESQHVINDNQTIGLIREYNYLVEKHFKQFTQVSDYAEILHRSPKTLSNIFAKHIDKTPLQVINDRRLVEAKHLLKYTQKTIQSIADELNFSDIQSFSRFFKDRQNESPTAYRQQSQS